MKRAGVVPCFALLLFLAFLKDAGSQSNLVQQLAPGVYYRTADREKRIIANTGWIVFRDYVLVIDANFPWGAKAVLADIKRTTSKPIRYVFDTHYHGDHAWGNSVFVDAGASIICSEECAGESIRKNTPSWAKNTEKGEYSIQPYRLEHPQIRFRDKMVFDDGEKRVELIRVGPGHTKGDAVAWLPKQRILFTGDLCTNFAGNNLADEDADYDNWLRALDSMRLWNPTHVVPGHGTPGPAPGILSGQRAYLAQILSDVRTGVAKRASADQLVREIDLSKHQPWGQDRQRNETAIRSVFAKLSRR